MNIPEKPSLEGLEARWTERWESLGTYRFDRSKTRDQVYAIDTPPPTASGSLHVGSVFSYTHPDLIARYKRMRGLEVFYPMGWDDNGLPTERRVQNYFGVRCDPTQAYDPDFRPPEKPSGQQIPISRRNFVELCRRLVTEDEREFAQLWKTLGLSVDWSYVYSTIGAMPQAVSQKAFLRNLARGEAYVAEAPTIWDVTFRTAVAQAEVEDRERPGAFHRLAFRHTPSGERLEIDTTRPELLPACVALVAHPGDERYQHLSGSTARTPLFDVEVPILAHRLADPEKGTGLAMICTFGDVTDVTWWRELDLPIRAVIGRDGRFLPQPLPWLDNPLASKAYAEITGLTVARAQRRTVELLRESGDLIGEPRPITHPVNFYENGELPLEIVTSRQWYIRNGARDPELRNALLARGSQLSWVPEFMRHRYEHWVEGLSGDWLISRQRYFGVPIPVWYALDGDGEPDYANPLVPQENRLPIDPTSDVPDGYTEAQRGQPGGFVGEVDIMDTWATSSLTPHIACGWERDPDLFARTFPMDLDTHAHEIIRTWLYYRVVRAHLENDALPWRTAMISGWVTDPDRKKMSKSKGAAVTPIQVLERYGADAVRWRAAGSRPGMDTPFDEAQMKVGRRLAIKILNASRFVLGSIVGTADGAENPSPQGDSITEPLDLGMLARLGEVVTTATDAFEAYDYTSALESTERFFWTFCDDYLELVKDRAYAGSTSARGALTLALSVLLRLFAPVMPYVTEEVWSWTWPSPHSGSPSWTHEGSIHRAAWPTIEELPARGGDPALLDEVGAALSAIRGEKSGRKLSLRTELDRLELAATPSAVTRLALARGDLATAGRIADLVLTPDPAAAAGELAVREFLVAAVDSA